MGSSSILLSRHSLFASIIGLSSWFSNIFTTWSLKTNGYVRSFCTAGNCLQIFILFIKNMYPLPYPVLSFCPSSCIVRYDQPIRDPIWGDDWLHRFHRRSSSWGFPGLSSAMRQMPGDLCRTSSIISLSPLSIADRRDWRYTRGKWPLVRNPDWSWWHWYIVKLSWPQPMAPWTTGLMRDPHPFLLFFSLPPLLAVRSYRRHLEVRS